MLNVAQSMSKQTLYLELPLVDDGVETAGLKIAVEAFGHVFVPDNVRRCPAPLFRLFNETHGTPTAMVYVTVCVDDGIDARIGAPVTNVFEA